MDAEVREQRPVCDGGVALVSFSGYAFLVYVRLRQKVVGEESGNGAKSRGRGEGQSSAPYSEEVRRNALTDKPTLASKTVKQYCMHPCGFCQIVVCWAC